MEKRAIETAKNIGILLSLGIVYYFLYYLFDIGFKCPLNSLTGLLCPVCGITRMLVSLLHLDFSSAIYYNAALLLVLPLFIAVIVSYNYRYVRYGERGFIRWHKVILIVCTVVLAVFGALRNVIPLGLPPFAS